MGRTRCRPCHRARLALQSHGRSIYSNGDACHHADMPPTLYPPARNTTQTAPFPKGKQMPGPDRRLRMTPEKLRFSVLKNKDKNWLLPAGIRAIHARNLARRAACPLQATERSVVCCLSSVLCIPNRINCSSICGLVERSVRASLLCIDEGSGDPVRDRLGNDAHVRASGAGS